jgi:CD109 antigen
LITDENGYAFVTLTTPDSITSWGIEAIASTKDAQLGTGETNVTVFQEFFVEPDIPVSVVRGDEFPLRVLVYNYDSVESNITIELASDSWFTLLSDSVQYAVVDAQSVSSVDFVIQAEKVGDYNITINASTPTLADKVVKEMTVEPDGKKVIDLRNGQLQDDSTATEALTLSSDRVPNSENAYVKLQGGMEAVVMDGAEDFIRFVSGCGEQSTSKLSVDIAAYKNLQGGSMTVEELFEYEVIINQGIQHEMQYLVNDAASGGKAIVWHSGESPDIWLTAWAVFAFQDLKDAGFNIDDDIISGFQTYLVYNQASDGSWSFPDVGHWSINSDLEGEKVAATAYITRALLYCNYPSDSDAIQKAVSYLEGASKPSEDSAFTVALTLTALEDAGGNSAVRSALADRLMDLAKEEDGKVSWKWSENSGNYWDYYRDNSIETTGYAIMGLHKHGGHGSTVSKAVKYLLTNRDGGGFGSTHDTAVAFQALDMFGGFNIDDVTVVVKADSQNIASIRFTEDNKDITYLIDLRPYLTDATTVELESSGKGDVLYQVFLEQYIPWDMANLNEPPELELNVSYNSQNISVNDYLYATMTLKYNGDVDMLKMVLIDLRAPVGFSFVYYDFQSLLNAGTINQYDIRTRQCQVYIDNVEANEPITFTYRLLANMPIRATLQGINAFDMYNPNLTTEIDPVTITVN